MEKIHKALILLIIPLFTIVSGCKKADELTHFTMEYDTEFIVPASDNIDLPIDIDGPEVETNSEHTFEINDTRKDLIEQIKLTKLELEILSPQDGDFSFVNSVTLYINADGLDEIEIASNKNISGNAGNKIELQTTDKDLQAYIKKDEVTLRANIVTDETISEDHTINAHAEFFVDAKVAK